ncbi:MAG: aspartate--tRNA ligase [Deltaproteobacteria bacterium]|nr:aspartate--tRNA ligase [Deltaproteobacteria bacterium]MBW2137456.1 aspartate--tRNA ligase [Deltaproteobacteria bacterium]
MHWKERTYCGELSKTPIGREVSLQGWVDALRDHGSLLFIHLRDISGIVQVVFDPKVNRDCYERARALKEEYVVEVRGEVALRGKGKENPHLTTGDIEVFAKELRVFSRSRALPFQISEKAMVFGESLSSSPDSVDEELRLRYRYLDLRRPSVQEIFIRRYRIIKRIRDYLDQKGFLEIETPLLTKSTPEGARDYLVPSRVHKGKFYALPQSPQLFKQILMMSGMDRYFQIAKCFRDEDLRPNRQPEFTQLDLEASFIDEEFIYELVEELVSRSFELGDITLPRPFPRMTYHEAVDRYGTDCPDLRFDMAFEDVTEFLRDTDYRVFRKVIRAGGRVKGFCIKGKAKLLSKNLLQNEYAMKIVPSMGAKGMTWMKLVGGNLESNIVQFFSQKELDKLKQGFGARDGDVILMIADLSPDVVNRALCNLRLHMGSRFGLVSDSAYAPLWVTDFPLFEEKEGALTSQHHPFTMPDRSDFDPDDRGDLLSLRSRAYDLVMNGEELGGGSIRIHDMDVQRKIFQALGLSRDEVEAKFGFFLRALEYGAPPHGGLALGLDRVISMILGVRSIREVIAFPKNRSAICPLTQAPSPAEDTQLAELGIRLGGAPTGLEGRRRAPWELEGPEPDLSRPERISRGEVMHVAKLARLRLSEKEIEYYQRDLNGILEYVEQLDGLDTEEVQPMSHVLQKQNVWREDSPRKAPAHQPNSILSNAPDREGNYYKVPKILEG